ncbi:MAG: hypothetical protein AVDCRST_MAG93-10082 [uncultured Chloroflexia bacterium]|uniref:Uncharacterized protein n=1 Tax=uncultured Chloroflexia bacterium TaxID=1672391 RepID=A0A6J4NV63_9CHLR|nr:MAG: hypothetical protein AVDCRST_MAG93-10082 [uncultured Chloroflexia bacterium]
MAKACWTSGSISPRLGSIGMYLMWIERRPMPSANASAAIRAPGARRRASRRSAMVPPPKVTTRVVDQPSCTKLKISEIDNTKASGTRNATQDASTSSWSDDVVALAVSHSAAMIRRIVAMMFSLVLPSAS